MKKNIFLIAAMLLLGACATEADKASQAADGKESSIEEAKPEETAVYHKISAEEAKKMMEEQTVIVVDVRTASEYAEGHIANAILIPNETIGKEAPAELPDKSAVLLVYCRSGRRSENAANKLLALGYQNVYDFGGISDWPYDIVKN